LFFVNLKICTVNGFKLNFFLAFFAHFAVKKRGINRKERKGQFHAVYGISWHYTINGVKLYLASFAVKFYRKERKVQFCAVYGINQKLHG